MSLRRLMNNWMTIQSSEGAQQTDQGAIARNDGWIEIEAFKNIQCHIQEKQRRSLINMDFALVGEEHTDIIYHLNINLFRYPINQTQLRIITNKIPTQKLSFPLLDEENVLIYEFHGHVQQVRRKIGRQELFLFRCSRTLKQTFA